MTSVTCQIVAVRGRQADVTTPGYPPSAPLRVDATGLARQLGVDVNQLPGMRFTADMQGAGLSDVKPLS